VENSRVHQLIQFILTVAGREDDPYRRDLRPVHIIKYLYLADMAYAARHQGLTWTGLPWTFHHFGPWATQAFSAIDEAARAAGASQRQVESQYRDTVAYRLEDDVLFERLDHELPLEITAALGRHVHAHTNDTGSLLNFVYTTPPMVSAAPEEVLNFSHAVDTAPARQPSAPVAVLTARQKKQRRQKLDEARARMAEAIARSRHRPALRSPQGHGEPIYDDVYDRGLQWLDSLAGPPLETTEGEFEVDIAVWRSAMRREPGVP